MRAKTLSVTLIGADADDGDVILADLKDFCANLTTCLRRTEEKIGEETRLDYRVVGLRRGSAVMKLRPVGNNPDPAEGERVLSLFAGTMKNLQAGKPIDSRFTSHDLLSFKKLAAPVLSNARSRLRSVRVGHTQITEKYVTHINQLLADPRVSEGSAKGTIEKLNLHGRHEFTLFPLIGPPIICTFRDNLFDRVREAIKRNVTVTGKMYHYLGSPFPDKAQVVDIDIHPKDSDLPRLSDLRGAMEKDADGRTAAQIVRALRDG